MQLPFQNSHAFLIGVDNYQHVSPLNTAINDTKALAQKLFEDHDYVIHGPLLNPTKVDLLAYIEDTIKKVVKKDDRIFFYFAGHGVALGDKEDANGYLVPLDAEIGKVDTLLSMEALHEVLTNLPCRHGLIILDCCFSGAFKWSSKFRDVVFDLPGLVYEQRFYQYLKDPAWQVITSAAADQKAMDVLTDPSLNLRDKAQQKHSPFASALLSGISGEADMIPKDRGDGVITATELYTYLRDRVEDATMAESKRQSPSFFSLEKHDKGQFIFLHPKHPLNLPPVPDRNPFMGLKSFNEADASLFYGRDRVITTLKELIDTKKFVVVSGASGTGKSSVIKAGLLPKLRQEDWTILPIIRPGKEPLKILAEKIPAIETVLKKGHKTILVIDQYEELITQCQSSKEKIAFENQLADWLLAHSNLKIIISVRADFEPQFEKSSLANLWQDGRYNIPIFSNDELREIILKPTLQEVLFFEPESLVDDLVDEVNQAPGALPLLSFTLSELYYAYLNSDRTNRALTEEDYKKLGGVVGALSMRANEVYEDLNGTAQKSMQQLMLRMMSIEGSEYAGKQVLINHLEFSDSSETERIKNIANQLVEARLIRQGTNGQEQVFIEPAHDALIRSWLQLREWVKAKGAEKIALHRKLAIAVDDYQEMLLEQPKEAKQLLWNNNPRLDLVFSEITDKNHSFNIYEEQFVQQSMQMRRKKKKYLNWGILGGIFLLAFGFIQLQINQELKEAIDTPLSPLPPKIISLKSNMEQNIGEKTKMDVSTKQTSILPILDIKLPPSFPKNALIKQSSIKTINYKQVIRDFIASEDNRDIASVLSFYNFPITRYWRTILLNKDELKDKYKRVWKNSVKSENKIVQIDTVNDTTFLLHTDFTFLNKSRVKSKPKRSKVKYVFNKSGKICEIYTVD